MCFANAALQLLASSALLNAKDAAAELEDQRAVGPALARALAAVNAFSADERPADARPLLQHVARKRPDMDGRTQQDSHEALMLLLDLLDDEAAAVRRDSQRGGDTTKGARGCILPDLKALLAYGHGDAAACRCIAAVSARKGTVAGPCAGGAEAPPPLLRRLLEGSIKSQVTCATCSTLSESQQPLWVMTLPLPPSATAAPDDTDVAGRPLYRSGTSKAGQLAGDGASEKRGRKGLGPAKERDKDKEKEDRKVSRKEQKAAEKRERRNQRRERKLEKQRHESGTEPDDGSDLEASGA